MPFYSLTTGGGLVEAATFAALPATGATATLYVVTATNTLYRWSGSAYVEVSPTPAELVEAANLAAFPATGSTGKLYVAQDTGKVYRWSGSAYVEVSGSDWSTITGKPSTFAPSTHAASHATGGADAITPANIGAAAASHAHGNITNDGKIGAESGYIVTTGTGGSLVAVTNAISGFYVGGADLENFTTDGSLSDTLASIDAAINTRATAGSYATLVSGTIPVAQLPVGTSSTQVCAGNDARLSDPRSPTSHSHGSITNDGKIGTASGQIITTGSGGTLQASATIAAASVSGLAASATTDATNASNIASGTLAIGRIPTGTTSTTVCQGDDVRLRAVSGLGNLREWFDRQFNAFSDTSESGKNKRVSIALFGDSLAQRMGGWLAYFTGVSHNYANQSGGFGSYGGPVWSSPTGPSITLGTNPQTTGDVTSVTNGFSIWANGIYFDVGPGGTIYWPFVTGSTVDLWKFFYVAEPSAATFDIEIASSTSGPWTKLGASVDAANATQIGAVQTRSTGTYLRRFVRIRNTHATARVKVIDAYYGWASTVRGYDGVGISQGGISPSQAAQASAAIYTPIMASLDPGLVVIHFDDVRSQYEDNWAALLGFLRAGNPNRSLLFVANGPHSGNGDAAADDCLRFFVSKIKDDNIAVVDMPSLLSSYSATNAQGWIGDGIHLNQRAYAYAAQRVWSDLAFGGLMSIIAADRATIRTRLSVPEIRLESAPGENLFATGVTNDYYFRIVADTSSLSGARMEVARDFSIANKGNTVTLLYLTPNEAVFGNRLPERFYRSNASSETIPGGYTSITSGVLEWTSGNKRILRDQSSAQVLRLGPFTGEASLDFPSIDPGSEATLTVSVTGVTTTGKFSTSVGWSAALADGIVLKQSWVSAANTVSVTVRNVSSSTIDPVAVTAYVVAMGIA